MHAFLTGDFFYFSLGVCLVGSLVRLTLYIKGLSWQLDRVAYGVYPGAGLKGAFISIYKWLLPFGTRSWRTQPAMALAFFTFHIGAICLPLFLLAHTLVWESTLGISLPALDPKMADIMAILALAALGFLGLRRLILPQVRILTTGKDIFLIALSAAPFITGLAARYQMGDYVFWLNAHILSGELILLAIPFTKFSHIFLFFASRAQIGMDFGIKRGGMKGSNLNW